MLRAKYSALRKGIDNVDYLEKMCNNCTTQFRNMNRENRDSEEQMKESKSSIPKDNFSLFGNMK